jgi:TPP-dependent pyruvate/acetoin dehydrogenase alpha subunit
MGRQSAEIGHNRAARFRQLKGREIGNMVVELDAKKRIEMLKKMMLIRAFEERAAEYFTRGIIRGSLHTTVGQEAVAVGVCSALEKNDYVQTTHRGHGHVLAKGLDEKLVMAELFGKATGYCKGKGGSMHVASLDHGVLGANGIVGGGNPVAVGAGFALAYKNSGCVSVSFFGDGASNNGTFHESCNLAQAWKLPVIFVNENNGFAISTPFRTISGTKDIADRAVGYGMRSEIADGMDVLDVYEKTLKAREYALVGNGPTLLECKTYRFVPHSKADREVYRTKEEVAEWRKKCPIKRLGGQLIAERSITERDIESFEKHAAEAIDMAVQFASESPDPEPEELYRDVYGGN